jgi:hypothetical protein
VGRPYGPTGRAGSQPRPHIIESIAPRCKIHAPTHLIYPAHGVAALSSWRRGHWIGRRAQRRVQGTAPRSPATHGPIPRHQRPLCDRLGCCWLEGYLCWFECVDGAVASIGWPRVTEPVAGTRIGTTTTYNNGKTERRNPPTKSADDVPKPE